MCQKCIKGKTGITAAAKEKGAVKHLARKKKWSKGSPGFQLFQFIKNTPGGLVSRLLGQFQFLAACHSIFGSFNEVNESIPFEELRFTVPKFEELTQHWSR